MPQVPQPMNIRADFLIKLEELKVKAVCGREYVQTVKLTKWLSEIPSGSSNARLDQLLMACYRHTDRFSINTKQVSEGNERCILVFCILLELDEGHRLSDCIEHEFFDSNLPLPLANLQKGLLGKKDLAQKINARQWKYCPFRFELNKRRVLPYERILPICEKQAINKKGGTAYIHEILVQEEFVHKSIREALPASRHEDSEYGPCYHFALKTYKDGNEAIYENETNAFNGLQGNEGLIRYLLKYTHVEDDEQGQTSFNILLEYGDCDLQDYFYFHLPPVFEEEQVCFWSDMCLVADAVRNIHEFQHHGVGGAEKYYGWHADIKPDNILNVQGQFKLADPGFACFEKQSDLKIGSKDATQYMGGTSTFGAPECCLGESLGTDGTAKKPALVTRSIDIWSLGCCLSVAATWVVFGRNGLDQFTELRKGAIDSAMADKSRLKPQLLSLGEGDYFHDGEKVLDEVLEWHTHLRGSLRRNDVLTEEVLQLVEEHMLLGNAQSRISATDLYKKLQQMLKKARERSKTAQHNAVLHALHRVEESFRRSVEEQAKIPPERRGSMTLQPNYSSKLGPRDKGPMSASLLGAPLQTSHRSKAAGMASRSVITASRILNPQWANQPSRMIVQSPVKEEKLYRERTQSVVGSPPLSTARSQDSAGFSPPAANAPSHTQTGFSTWTTTNKRNRFSLSISKLKDKTKRTPKGDDFLKQFYINRDIIFVVDNGASMAGYWDAASARLNALVTKAMHIDKDGMELKFTVGDTKFKPTNDPKNFAREMVKKDHLPKAGIETHMSQVLGSILSNYLKKNVNKRKLTIIVLTDGMWKAMQNDFAVDQKIIDFSGHMQKARPNNLEDDDRRVSIQFVQFGNDPKASHRLKRLDDNLKFKGVPDIVDTASCDEDVEMILTGSLDESRDERQTSITQMASSPEAMEGFDSQNGTPSKPSTKPSTTSEPSSLDLSENNAPQRHEHPRNPGTVQIRPSMRHPSSDIPSIPSFKVDEHG